VNWQFGCWVAQGMDPICSSVHHTARSFVLSGPTSAFWNVVGWVWLPVPTHIVHCCLPLGQTFPPHEVGSWGWGGCSLWGHCCLGQAYHPFKESIACQRDRVSQNKFCIRTAADHRTSIVFIDRNYYVRRRTLFGCVHRQNIDPRQRQGIFPLASVFRPALGPTQPPVQCLPGVLSPGVKRGRGLTLTTHPHLVPRSWMSRSYTSSPPGASMACSGTALLFFLTFYRQWRGKWMMNWKEYERKWYWRNLRCCPSISLEGLRKNTKELQDNLSSVRDLKPGPPGFEAWMLTTRSRRSVWQDKASHLLG
jgi:hypothetical protein